MADGLYRLGVEHHLADRFADAAAAYEKALKIAPNHAAVLNNHGGVYLRLAEASSASAAMRASHRKRAERSLRAATRHAPQNLDAYSNLGVLYKADGRVEEAIAACSAARALAPKDSSTHERLGGAHMLAVTSKHGASVMKHAKAAADAFASALALNPSDGILHERRGEAHIQIAKLHDDDPGAHAAVEAQAAYAAAVESLASAVRLAPRESTAYAKLAIAAHGVGAHTSRGALDHILSAMHQLQLGAHEASRVWAVRPRVMLPTNTTNANTLGVDDGYTWQWTTRDVTYNGDELPGAEAQARAAQAQAQARGAEASQQSCSVRAVGMGVGDDADTHGESGDDDGVCEGLAEDATVGGAGSTGGTGGAVGAEPSCVENGLSTARGYGRLLAAFATPIFVYRLQPATARSLNRRLLPELLAREKQQASVRHSNRGGWQSSPDLLSGGALHPSLASLRAHTLDAFSAFVERLDAASARTPPSPRAGAQPPRLRVSVLNSWANVNRRGHHNLFHDHPQATLSGVYFVDDGQRRAGDGPRRAKVQRRAQTNRTAIARPGAIELIDPRYTLRSHRPPEQFEPPCSALGSDAHPLRHEYLFEYAPPLQIDPTPGAFVLFPAWLMHRVRPHGLATARVSVSFNVWLADEDGGLYTTRRLFDSVFDATAD